MQVDWFTTIAQLANFLALLWLLRRFLFRPVLATINQRQEEIARRFEDAAQSKKSAEVEKAKFAQSREALEAQSQDLIAEAQAEAKRIRESALEDAKSDARAAREGARAALASERREFLAAMRKEGSAAVLSVSRDVLMDLADTTLEAVLARRLCAEISACGDEFRTIAQSGEPLTATLSAGTSLTQEIVTGVAETLERFCGRDVTVSVAEVPDNPMRVILELEDLRVEWSLDAHIQQLVEALERTLPSDLGCGAQSHAVTA